jgi:hypothetical protein
MPSARTASDVCKAILRELQTNAIPPRLSAVADRLLSRPTEMQSAYSELCLKFESNVVSLKVFFDALMRCAAFWSPECAAEARQARDRLHVLNDEIAATSRKLEKLVKEREFIHNNSDFHSNTYAHPIDLIESASSNNFLHDAFVRAPLSALRARYGTKYWPSIPDCLSVLAADAANAKVRANNLLTHASTRVTRRSLADFLRALFVSIEENRVSNHGFLPDKAFLSDATFATLVNCALDLGPDDMIDAAYVKRMRQGEREKAVGRT